jgi:CcmD family protein
MTLRRCVVLFLLLIALAPGVVAQQPRPEPQDEFVPISELPPQDQLPSAPLLIAAYAFVWLALGGYVLSVARRLNSVQREVERLDTDVKKGSRA